MKVNIYLEIFNILNEYELLLKTYHDKNFIINEKNNKQDNNYSNNINEFVDNDFLNYIFNSVKIKKNINQTHINEKQESSNNQESNNEELNNNNEIKNNISLNNNQKELNNNNEIPNNTPLNNDDKSNNNQTSNNDDKSNNNDTSNNNEIYKFIKKYYRKIVLLTHPDKTNDITKNNIFKKAKDNFENKFLIGIIKNCYDLKIEITDLTQSLFNHIMFEIRVIQEKIIELRNIINT